MNITSAELAAHYAKPPLDPIARYADYQAHPEAYCTVSEVVRRLLALREMRTAQSLTELRQRFIWWRDALKGRDDALLALVVAEKDRVKIVLEAK